MKKKSEKKLLKLKILTKKWKLNFRQLIFLIWKSYFFSSYFKKNKNYIIEKNWIFYDFLIYFQFFNLKIYIFKILYFLRFNDVDWHISAMWQKLNSQQLLRGEMPN